MALTKYFIYKYNGNGKKLENSALDTLLSYNWPGNVRELEACITRAIINSSNLSIISCKDIELTDKELNPINSYRTELENVLTKTNGNIKSTAILLGVHRNTIYNKISKLRIDLNQFISVLNEIWISA